MKVDTHLHTTFSDGGHSVSTVAAKAVEYGCDAIAITDHADHNLAAATPDYEEAIQVARRQHENLIVLAGLEWNVPPFGGDDHATVLVAPAADEFLQLAKFKAQFDDYGRETHEEQLAIDALKWLHDSSGATKPLVISNHPSRKLQDVNEIATRLKELSSVNNILVGFSGAPGHQKAVEIGAYKNVLKTVDRWDPAAEPDGRWDQLLRQGIDLWAARAPSDFHEEQNDYWPGEFSETWLYVPERTAEGVLKSLRAGSFFAAHGHIVREVQLTVETAGLSRPAFPGESIEVPADSQVTLQLTAAVPETDWAGAPNHIDAVEFFLVTEAGVEAIGHEVSPGSALNVIETIRVPPEGVVVRARGRRVVEDGPDLMFYTNPIRIEATAALPASALTDEFRAALNNTMVRRSVAAFLAILVVVSALTTPWRHTAAVRGADVAPTTTLLSAPRRIHYFFAAVGFTTLAVYGSLVPLNYTPTDWNAAVERFQNIPYLQLSLDRRADWVSNILLFVPIAYCWMGVSTVDHAGRRLQFFVLPVVIVGCVALSIGLEFTQIWFPPRTVSQNDIIAESLGGLIGGVLWIFVGQRATQWMRCYTATMRRSRQLEWLLQAYLVGLIIYSLLPLDLTIHPVEIYRKYREGKIVLLPYWGYDFGPQEVWSRLTDIFVFIPVGVLAARAYLPQGQAVRPFLHSVGLGALAVVGIEMGQLLVYSRFTETTDLITGTLGIVVGVWLARQWAADSSADHARPNRSFAWLAVAVAYSIVLCTIFWWPFEFASNTELVQERAAAFLKVPFASMYWGSELNAATQIVRKTVLFLVLGMIVAKLILTFSLSKSLRLVFVAVAMLLCALLATGIELVQSFLPEHTVDITDTMMYTLGTAAGLTLTLRLSRATEDAVASDAAPAMELPDTRRTWRLRPKWLGYAAATVAIAAVGSWIVLDKSLLFGERDGHLAGGLTAAGKRSVAQRFGTTFTPIPQDPSLAPQVETIEIPGFQGAYAVWGATGRDDRGHIWFGVSAAGVDTPSAHLFEYDPDEDRVVDRGSVVSELKRAGVYRRGEGQMKIHSKIVQADDGFLYFASMDEQGENEDGSRLPTWGSHLWRLNLANYEWEHLQAAPEGLIALSCVGRWVYVLGYFDHVLYQYDTQNGTVRKTAVGSVAGHISRNLVSDPRGQVYVPRLQEPVHAPDTSSNERYPATLVEFDTELEEVSETPLDYYGGDPTASSHGIIGFTHLVDDSIVFATHRGHLYRIVPGEASPAQVEALGWFHPEGEAYTASMFSFSGKRYLAGVGRRRGQPYEWIVYDLEKRTATAEPLPLNDCVPEGAKDLLLYGSLSRDNQGRFYLAGRYIVENEKRPILLQMAMAKEVSETFEQRISGR